MDPEILLYSQCLFIRLSLSSIHFTFLPLMQHLGNLAIETDMMKLVESKLERSMGKNCVKKFVNSIIQDLGELK